MKKIIAVLALCVSVMTFATAQQETEAVKKTEAVEAGVKAAVNGPAINFEATTVDYGTIEQGADPYRVFNFTNTGTEPLVIKNAKGSCGCTVPEWPKEPILPGETGQIQVRYDTNRVGPINKTVTLTTNASGTDERVTLMIKGEVQKKAAEPSGLPTKTTNPFNGGN